MKLTSERRERAFHEALTWHQFLETMKVNRNTIEANYAGFQLTASDLAFLNGLPGVTDVLVLAHDWCGDVVANLPLFAKIEAETGKLRLHIVPKDPDNVDIGKIYPHPDGDVHIPIYVFFDAQGREKGHFIERTTEMTDRIGLWILQFWKSHPEWKGQGKDFSTLLPEVKQALLDKLGAERPQVRDLEKKTIFEVLGKMLA
jgi:Thioredoxin